MFAVGITNQVNVDELKTIVSDPAVLNSNYWLIEDYTDLASYASVLAEGLCEFEPAPATTAAPAAECNDYRVDLVFVVDSSGSIRDANPTDGSYDNWNLILQYVYDVIELLNIGSDQTRVGLIAYSQTAVNMFYLNT